MTRPMNPATEPLRALLLESVHPDGARLLEASGFAVESLDRAMDPAELTERIGGVHVLGLRSKTRVTADVIEAGADLVAVGAFCIGTDQIAMDAASAAGVAVFNAPYSNTRSVVELALGEIIALTRRLTQKNDLMHAGVWDKSAAGAREVRGRTLGIVGYGNIGAQLSVVAEALGMRVCFYDTADKLTLGNAHRCGSLDELLAAADVVTLHVDGRSGNAGFFGEAQFAAMRPGALFLNLSRGFVIDMGALRAALESGRLAGAAVDVFAVEPSARGEEFRCELRGLPNVILTPHIGGSTEEAQQDIGRFVAGKLAGFVHEGASTLSVNIPGLALPERLGAHRVAHLHANVPGVMASINKVMADHGVNVEGQLLGTRGTLGYVLTDIGAGLPPEAVDRLRALPETVRLRVLS